MEILGKIKRLYFRDKKSLHDIARLTGLSRNTIRKWVREPLGDEALKYVRQDMPSKLAAYRAEIEQALKADSHRIKGSICFCCQLRNVGEWNKPGAERDIVGSAG